MNANYSEGGNKVMNDIADLDIAKNSYTSTSAPQSIQIYFKDRNAV